VWEALTNQAAQPTWRPGLKANVRQPDEHGHEVWRNELKNGSSLTIEIDEAVPAQKLVTRVVDKDAPFGGAWTFALQSTANGTRLTIDETGWVTPAIMRAVAYYFIGFHTTMETYLKDLAKRFGENAAPTKPNDRDKD
jgi:uncharacterized protein YndB with AHSA1/START domain